MYRRITQCLRICVYELEFFGICGALTLLRGKSVTQIVALSDTLHGRNSKGVWYRNIFVLLQYSDTAIMLHPRIEAHLHPYNPKIPHRKIYHDCHNPFRSSGTLGENQLTAQW